jgi:hypothetical protein
LIAGYRQGGCHYQLRLPRTRDVHDILWHQGELVCVATGSNEILWLDPLGHVTRRWQGKGTRDAWHLNCLWEAEGKLYVSAFGRFDDHRGWVGKCTEKGFVAEAGTERDVVTGLSGPHNPRFIDGQWMVCDSHANGLFVQRPGEPPRQIPLGGFTRGFAFDENFLYIGVSADRKALTPAMESAVAILDRRTFAEVQRITIPFPEIYDVLLADPELCTEMASSPEIFQVAPADSRCVALEAQVELGWKEINSLQRRLEPLLTIEEWRGRLVDLKRRVLG